MLKHLKLGKLVNDEEPVVWLGRDRIVEEGDHAEVLASGHCLYVGQFLDVIVGEDKSVEGGEALLQILPNPADTVVVEEQALQPGQIGEVVHLADLIVREVDGVKLIECGTQVLDQWDFVA